MGLYFDTGVFVFQLFVIVTNVKSGCLLLFFFGHIDFLSFSSFLILQQFPRTRAIEFRLRPEQIAFLDSLASQRSALHIPEAQRALEQRENF